MYRICGSITGKENRESKEFLKIWHHKKSTWYFEYDKRARIYRETSKCELTGANYEFRLSHYSYAY